MQPIAPVGVEASQCVVIKAQLTMLSNITKQWEISVLTRKFISLM